MRDTDSIRGEERERKGTRERGEREEREREIDWKRGAVCES